MPRRAIAVIGAGTCDAETRDVAYDTGRLIAERGGVVVTGGGTGVMEAASQGAHDAGGLVIGILPGPDAAAANPAVDVAIPTGMGQLRNGLVVASGEAVIAVGGEWGTLSEIGFACKLGKPVVAWRSWELYRDGNADGTVICVESAEEAVTAAFAVLEKTVVAS